MYTHCHICSRALGSNTLIGHMPVGRKVAFDATRGRLWIVCRRCGEWNLTPMEVRWEAIEECERLFERAEARASSDTVGVARLEGLELIRVGATATHDDIANWRYGHRFARRRGRVRMLRFLGGAVGLLLVVQFTRLGFRYGTWSFAAYLAYFAALVAWQLQRMVRPRSSVRFTDTRGERVQLPASHLEWVQLARTDKRSRGGTIALDLHLAQPHFVRPRGGRRKAKLSAPELVYENSAALPALRAILPRLNWNGASESAIRAAVALVDEVEEREHDRASQGKDSEAAWRRLAHRSALTGVALASVAAVERLALEMAVTEAFERRALAGEAALLGEASTRAGEIAAIADDLFLSARVTEWIDRQRARSNPTSED